jgi:hypothetical protein
MYIRALKDFKWSFNSWDPFTNRIEEYKCGHVYIIREVKDYNEMIELGYAEELFPDLYGKMRQLDIRRYKEYRSRIKSKYKNVSKKPIGVDLKQNLFNSQLNFLILESKMLLYINELDHDKVAIKQELLEEWNQVQEKISLILNQ